MHGHVWYGSVRGQMRIRFQGGPRSRLPRCSGLPPHGSTVRPALDPSPFEHVPLKDLYSAHAYDLRASSMQRTDQLDPSAHGISHAFRDPHDGSNDIAPPLVPSRLRTRAVL